MKILAFADMHGSRKALAKVKKSGKEADLVLCCGDLTIFEQDLAKILRELNSIKKPVLILPGNHESGASLKKACERHANLVYMDARIFGADDLKIFGAEGNGFAMRDPHFEKVAKKFSSKMVKKSILMTHAPPYGTELDRLEDGHCGNKSVRDFIVRHKPLYAFSGHIHENNGKEDKLGSTRLVNPGPSGTFVLV